ncbi:MAG: O-antigen ligase family protein [Flavobacteriaceae bacterium]|nr:O-antigen ligase family protein [Flavobacteriaceae bacterium]
MHVKKNIKTLVSYEKLFVILISLILITLPLKHNINSITIMLFLVFTLAHSLFYKNKITFNKASVLFISIYILAVLSLLWTINMDISIKGLQKMLSFLALPLGFILMPKLNNNNVLKVIKYFSFAMVFFALYCLIIGIAISLKTNDTSFLFYHTLSSPLNEINAIYLSVYISFSIFYFILSEKLKKNITAFLLTVLIVFLILLSSKIIISFTFVAISAHLLLNKRKLWFVLVIIVLISSIFILMPNASNSINNRVETELFNTRSKEILTKNEFGQTYYWTGFGLRLFQAKSYFEMINEDQVILTGYGIRASQEKLIKKYKEYNLYSGFYSYNFHNQYLQILAELGILGFLFLILIFGLGIYNSIKQNNLLFLGFNFLILFICITESYLWRQRGMVFFITLFLLFYIPSSNFYLSKKQD